MNHPNLLALFDEILENKLDEQRVVFRQNHASALDEFVDMCAQRKEVVAGISLRNEFWNAITDLHPKYRILFDLLLRITTCSRHPAQVFTHMNKLPKGTFLPRRPWGLPAYFYHITTRISSITSTIQQENGEKEKWIAVDYAEEKLRAHVYNGHVEIIKESDGEIVDLCFENNNYHQKQYEMDLCKIDGEYERIKWNKFKLVLVDGDIIDEVEKKPVKVYLNNKLIENEKIKKIEFFNKQGVLEVMILFERYFMAGGFITQISNKEQKEFRKSAGGYHSRLICNVNEISGTYGTTDFQCSEDFQSMLRTSHVPLSLFKIHEEGITEKINLLFDEMSGPIKNLNEKLKNPGFEHFYTHTKTTGFLQNFCASLQNIVDVFWLGFKNRIQFPLDSRNWTGLEKLIFLQSRALKMTKMKERSKLCEQGKPCDSFKRVLKFAATLRNNPNKFPFFKDELLHALVMQLYMAIIAMFQVINRGHKRLPTDNEARLFMIMVHFRNIHRKSIHKQFSLFKFFPSTMQPMLYECLCERALPHHYTMLLDIYEDYPVIVTQAIRKYPHVMLFSPHVALPPIKLIKDLACHLKKVIDEKNEEDSSGAIAEADNSPFDTFNTPKEKRSMLSEIFGEDALVSPFDSCSLASQTPSPPATSSNSIVLRKKKVDEEVAYSTPNRHRTLKKVRLANVDLLNHVMGANADH